MRRWLTALAGPVAALGAVALLLGPELGGIAAAARGVQPAVLAGACALHALALTLRAEAWRVVLAAAAGRRQGAGLVHGASAWAFLAGAAAGQLTMPVRLTVLRRSAPARAPTASQIVIAELPVLAVELACTLAFVLFAAGGRVSAAGAAALAAGIVGALVALRLLHARLARHPFAAGLAVLADPRARHRLLAAVAMLTTLSAARIALLLAAFGLPHGVAETGLVLGAMALTCVVPIGPASGPVGTLAVLAGAGAAAAAAAGLAIAATSMGGTVLYALAVGLVAILRRGPAALRRPAVAIR